MQIIYKNFNSLKSTFIYIHLSIYLHKYKSLTRKTSLISWAMSFPKRKHSQFKINIGLAKIVHSGFSLQCCRKTQTNFLTNPIK